ncbi:unnamed protein product [Fusarium langsethiae]|nr:unnamed protein product [Fusarium langsethiae]
MSSQYPSSTEPSYRILESFPDEETPLIPPAQNSSIELKSPSHSPWLAEIIVLVKASVPVILAYMLQNSLQTVSVLMVGRLSPEALATAAFSYMFAMATAWLIALGGTTAIDTLGSIVAVMWCFSGYIFRSLGQEEFICVQGSRFLRFLIPGGLGYVWFEAMKKFLQAQEIYRPGTYALLVISPLNALLNWFFIYTLGFGLDGAPIATGISYWLCFLVLVGYTAFVKGSECWGGFNLGQAIQHVGPFAKLAFLGVIHVGTEWWAFEIVALAAGRLGTIPLAAQSVVMTLDQIINTIPFGLGVAASSRLGNLLGLGDASQARRCAHSAALLSIFFGAIILTTLLCTKDHSSRTSCLM